MNGREPAVKSKLVIVALMLFTVFVGFGIIIPVLPQIVADVNAESAEWHTGLMLTAYSLISFLLSPFWGGLSERVGRRPVIMIGVLGFSASFLLFGLSGGNLVMMYASRLLGGLFSGAVVSCIVAYVADITTNEERTKGMAVIGMSIGLGFTFGPLFGGLLSKVTLYTPFFVASALSLVTFAAAAAVLKESLPPEARAEAGSRRAASRWTAFRGSLKYLYVLAFFVTFSLAILEATLVRVGLMFFFCGLTGAAVQGGFVRRKVKAGQEGAYIAAGLVFSAAGFLLLLTAHHWIVAMIDLCIFGVGNSLIKPCVTSLITQKTTVGQGVASGLSSSMDSLGRIVGPLLGAALFHLAPRLPFIVSGLLSLGSLALLAGFRKEDRRASSAAG